MTTQNAIEKAIEALQKAEKRGEKIRQALDFIRYGDKGKTMDGQALADAGNGLSALRTFINDALEALRAALIAETRGE